MGVDVVLFKGSAEVLQKPEGKEEAEVIGKLGPSDYFGEWNSSFSPDLSALEYQAVTVTAKLS